METRGKAIKLLLVAIWNKIWRNFFLVVLLFSILYVAFYSKYLLDTEFRQSFKEYDVLIKYLSQFAILSFSAGIFSASIKYLQFLDIFSKEIKETIISDEFTEVLRKQVTVITFSEESLLAQNNLDEVWKKVTNCRYKKRFPEMIGKIEKNLINELYEDNSLDAYYRNFQIVISIKLLKNNYIEIQESDSFTIITNDEKLFNWTFWAQTEGENDKNVYTELIKEHTKVQGISIDEYLKKEPEKESNIIGEKTLYSIPLKGKSEYHVERCIKIGQNLDNDRVFSFSSSKILDDLSVIIEYCDKLNVCFSQVGRNKFYPNANHRDKKAYINRNVFLPGEKFKLFIYKNDSV